LAIANHPVMALHVAVKEASRAKKSPPQPHSSAGKLFRPEFAAIIGNLGAAPSLTVNQ
jgi:hypothetical protein